MRKVKQKLLPIRSSESGASTTGSSSNSGSTTAPTTLLPVPEPESQLQALTDATPSGSLFSTVSRPYGLKKLYEGTRPVVDIVAVHGLNGHRETTWTDEGGVLWLRDLLPLSIPNIRVWTWGYDSRTHTKSHHDHLTIKKLYDHGRELVQELDGERRTDGSYQRPIIFVAHSLGGIVVKNALLHSDRVRQGHLEDERSIKLSTYGIIFMGTPHQGGQGVKIGEILLNMAKVRGNTNDNLLKHLEEHSELLQTQNSEFTAISQDFDIKFVYETLPTPIAGGAAKVIVPKWSAVVPGTPDAAEFGISQDHRQMIKFPSAEDQDFKKLSRVLVSMTQKAKVKIEKNWDSEGRLKQGRQTYDIPFNIRGVPVVGKYVERLQEMKTMVEILSPAAENKQRRILVLHGLGGVGKTQLGLAYARRYQHIYSAVFWLNGQTRESLEQSFAGLARQLPKDQIPDFDKRCTQQGNEQLDEVVHEVKSWFSRDGNCNWLLLYDNVDRENLKSIDDPKAFDVSDYLPECDQGSIIITTRQYRLRTLGDEMQLGKMREEEGLEVLESRIGKSLKENPQAYKLVDLVGGLPLALAQAASYMRATHTSMAEYLELYNTAWDDLMTSSAGHETTLPEYGNRSIQTTWTISFEGVKKKNEDAAKMLQVWSYLDNRDIWFEIFNNKRNTDLRRWSNPPTWFRRVVHDKLSFRGVAATLLAYSLIEAKQDSESYGVHPVVHEWCRKTVTTDRQPELAFLAITSVGFGAPDPGERNSWPTRRRLLQHANRFSQPLMDMLEKAFESKQANELYHAFSLLVTLYHHKDSRTWVKTEATQRRAVSGYEKCLGLHRNSTLSALTALAALYNDHKKFADAEALNRRVLAIRTEKLGLDHTDTMKTIFSLADVLSCSNQLAEAEILYQSLLMRSQMDLGFNKSLVFTGLGNLYQKQWKLVESEAMYLQAFAGYKTHLEIDHPHILLVRYNLGLLYEQHNRLVEAEATMRQVLEGSKKVFGVEHRETLKAMERLGGIFEKQGEFAEAEPFHEQTLASRRRVLGSEHPSTFRALRALAACYTKQDKFTEAEPLLLQCLESFKHIPFDQRTSTQLNDINTLGHIYFQQGRLAEAEAIFQQALSGYRRVLGLEHEATLRTLRNLMVCYPSQGRFAEAEPLFLQALESFKQNPNSQKTIAELDWRLAEAETIFQQALSGYQRVLGPEHESTLRTLRNLKACYKKQGKLVEAAALSPEDTNIERVHGHYPITNIKSARRITKRIKHSLLRRNS
ncbi:hypothetical protein BDR22DRAFT_963873 [Usnea florida]